MGPFSLRVRLGIAILVDFAIILFLLLWSGRSGEAAFFRAEFSIPSFRSCVSNCVVDVFFIGIARILAIGIFYVAFRISRSSIPILIIDVASVGLCFAEGVWLLAGFREYNVNKLYMIGVSIVLAVLQLVCFFWSREPTDEYDESRARRRPAQRDQSVAYTSYSRSIGQYSDSDAAPLLVNPQTVASIRESTLFRSSSVEQRWSHTLDDYVSDEPRHIEIEPPPPLPVKEGSSSAFPLPSVPRLMGIMLDEDRGIRLQERKVKFKTYHDCFSGSDGVDWLLQNFRHHFRSRVEAVSLGQELMRTGYVEHVTGADVYLDSDSALYRISADVCDKLPVIVMTPAGLPVRPPQLPWTDEPSPLVGKRKQPVGMRVVRRLQFDDVTEQEPLSDPLGDEKDPAANGTPAPPETVPDQTSPVMSNVVFVEDYGHNQGPGGKVGSPQASDLAADVYEYSQGPASAVELDATPSPRLPPKASPLLKNFVAEMRGVGGVPIKDRVLQQSDTQFTTYPRFFVGSDAVEWLVERMGFDGRPDAIKVLQRLMTSGTFHHVNDRATFDDGPSLYRFRIDD
eukprot:TRINITY_DN4834_c0_g1_i2.p1 TRINITY_DN4834_c0_g1~~TRINITY_DN4834_c0_g1_i2.p1  ORF type:complete len:567 (+),score=143.93 TRINITY_DN4834_c0_g1_i2:90-1790(+)